MSKIFQIGFNKCGTKSIWNFFKENGYSSVHHDSGKLALSMKYNDKNNQKLLNQYYEKFKVFTDMEDIRHGKPYYAHIHLFKKLDQQYPNSKFILNTRDCERWVKSRLNHGKYLQRCSISTGIPTPELTKKWVRQWFNHHKNVIDYFKDKPGKLLVFDIENDNIVKLVDFFPELKLDVNKWKHKGKSKKRII